MRFDTPYNQHRYPPHRTDADGEAPGGTASPPSQAKTWNSWWSRRSPNLGPNANEPARIGIDVGSKTVKLVAVDAFGNIVYSLYHRHRSDVRTTLGELLHDTVWRHGDVSLPCAITGSAGIALATELGIPFVQEVVATTNAVKRRHPQADCIIELGGEDAKITYLNDPVEQRMNATCAGGTGDFIDGIAHMLNIRTRELSKLALGSTRTYDIASRCAVFAQTDVRPLINAGARKADIAQSALEAVARQTLGGLACGRPIRGTVVFLGGPLEHIPALVMTFRRALGLDHRTGIKPPDAHLYAAMGAIETAADAPVVAFSELERRLTTKTPAIEGRPAGTLPPLFDDPADIPAFRARHAEAQIPTLPLGKASGNLYLGFDAGSTTCKYAVVDDTGALVVSDYREVAGDALETARTMLEGLLASLQSNVFAGQSARIAHATVTGYGEDMLRAGLRFDSGVVETVAHLRAAQNLCPDVSFMLDIGGQDMKALWIRDGTVVDAVLNEACSSGCGAFVQSSAKALGLNAELFTTEALSAAHPLDLGAKCTVFMTSRVRHAQKVGAPKGDIAAGIAYSVVNNVMTRIIGKSHALPLGDAVVVQGGTFKSDAVLRAFEKLSGTNVIRPRSAHLMGAFGAALIARDRALGRHGGNQSPQVDENADGGANATSDADANAAEAASLGIIGDAGKTAAQDHNDAACPARADQSSLISLEEIRALKPQKRSARCSGCGNACLVSVVDFGGGRRHLSGNRCERAHEALFGAQANRSQTADRAPNVVALEQKLISSYASIDGDERAGTRIGFMNTMNAYEATPFWHTLFFHLGFSLVVPDDDAPSALRARAAETIPSESACQPAKLTHMRFASLAAQGADIVFMPRFERGTRCPVACEYADALRDNVDGCTIVCPTIKAIRPASLSKRPTDRAAIFAAANELAGAHPITQSEFDAALLAALAEQERFEQTIARATDQALSWISHDELRRCAVLAGRPYHIDPALLHRIDQELSRLGFAVVPMLGLTEQLHALRGKSALWKPAKHLCELVEYAHANERIEIVALRSFGCLYDAVSIDEAHDIAQELGKPITELKIDDISDHAHIRIRLRTLAYTCGLGQPHEAHLQHAAKVASRLSDFPENVADRILEAMPAARLTTPSIDEPSSAHARRTNTSNARSLTPDLCSTAKNLIKRVVDSIDPARPPQTINVPTICTDCLIDALPFELAHVVNIKPPVQSRPSEPGDFASATRELLASKGTTGIRPSAVCAPAPNLGSALLPVPTAAIESNPDASQHVHARHPKVGLLGNPLLVFDEDLNEHVADLVQHLGWQPVFPDLSLIEIEDVRYLDQMRSFQEQGVSRVIYLQSFGCLKGHVHARGALHELASRFPGMPITVIDYDSESSALNRENRIRLALV